MELVICNNGKATTTSMKVAEYFEKRHDNVMAAIGKLLEDKEIKGRLNFKESSYTNEQNKQQPMYELDRDGFTLLAMGFNGKKALAFKLSYIDAFNKAEKALLSNNAFQIPQNFHEALQLAADQAKQIEQRDKMIAITAPKAAALDRITVAEGEMCISNAAKLLGYAKIKDFFQWLHELKWIFRRGGAWIAHQDKTRSGLLVTKVTKYESTDGSEKISEQALITAKGITKLAEMQYENSNLLEVA